MSYALLPCAPDSGVCHALLLLAIFFHEGARETQLNLMWLVWMSSYQSVAAHYEHDL